MDDAWLWKKRVFLQNYIHIQSIALGVLFHVFRTKYIYSLLHLGCHFVFFESPISVVKCAMRECPHTHTHAHIHARVRSHTITHSNRYSKVYTHMHPHTHTHRSRRWATWGFLDLSPIFNQLLCILYLLSIYAHIYSIFTHFFVYFVFSCIYSLFTHTHRPRMQLTCGILCTLSIFSFCIYFSFTVSYSLFTHAQHSRYAAFFILTKRILFFLIFFLINLHALIPHDLSIYPLLIYSPTQTKDAADMWHSARKFWVLFIYSSFITFIYSFLMTSVFTPYFLTHTQTREAVNMRHSLCALFVHIPVFTLMGWLRLVGFLQW